MDKDHISIYKGSCLRLKKNELQSNKIFVFDLDETIGHFSDVYMLFKIIDFIQKKYKTKYFENDEKCINYLLDLFPEVFRYGIEIILQYLHEKKKIHSTYVYIYTNNNCIPTTWTNYISKYIEKYWKLEGLFTNIVRAFKINGKIVENRRSTVDKNYIDFIHCVQLPENTELCFLDNSEHKMMKHRYVYYLQPKSFFCDISRFNIIERFIINIQEMDKNINFRNELEDYCKTQDIKINKTEKTLEQKKIDIKISKKLLHCIQKFYKYKVVKLKTRKKRKIIGNKTKKNRL